MQHRTVRPVFFIDRSLGGKQIPSILEKSGIEVRAHDSLFGEKASDETWIRKAGEKGWAFLTTDHGIERKANEVLVMLKAGVHGFAIANANAKACDQAKAILTAKDRIIAVLETEEPPTIRKIYMDGSFGVPKGKEELFSKFRRRRKSDNRRQR